MHSGLEQQRRHTPPDLCELIRAGLQVNERRVPVHDHGVAVLVWGTTRLPDIAALGADGSRLGPVRLRDFPGR
jgi:hypothetical protein